MTRGLVGLALAIMLAACGATPTPFPAYVTLQPSPSVAVSTVSAIRYGIAPELWGLVSVPDRPSVDLIPLAVDSGGPQTSQDYQVVVSVGQVPEGQVLPFRLRVGLIINPASLMLKDRALRLLLAQALEDLLTPEAQSSGNSSAAADRVRSALANLGWPDGINLKLAATDTSIGEQVIGRLQQAGMPPTLIPMDLTWSSSDLVRLGADAILVFWITEDERSIWVDLAGPDQFLPFGELAVWYRAESGVAIRFTDSGWPVPEG